MKVILIIILIAVVIADIWLVRDWYKNCYTSICFDKRDWLPLLPITLSTIAVFLSLISLWSKL